MNTLDEIVTRTGITTGIPEAEAFALWHANIRFKASRAGVIITASKADICRRFREQMDRIYG